MFFSCCSAIRHELQSAPQLQSLLEESLCFPLQSICMGVCGLLASSVGANGRYPEQQAETCRGKPGYLQKHRALNCTSSTFINT